MRTKGWNTVWQRIVFIMHSGQMTPGMKEDDDRADQRECLEGQAHTFILDESRGSEEHDEARRAGHNTVLTLVALHPRAVRPGVAGRENSDPSGEEQGAQGCGHEGDDDVLLGHGFIP